MAPEDAHKQGPHTAQLGTCGVAGSGKQWAHQEWPRASDRPRPRLPPNPLMANMKPTPPARAKSGITGSGAIWKAEGTLNSVVPAAAGSTRCFFAAGSIYKGECGDNNRLRIDASF